MNFTIGDGHHEILAQYDEHGNLIGGNTFRSAGDHTHQHTWPGNSTTVAPSAGWVGGGYTYRPNDYNLQYNNFPDVSIDVDKIMFQNKNLTKAVQDMALLLKIIVDKYDLHEVKKLVEESEIAVWAQDGKYKDICEKKEHLDEKLFEI